MPNCNKRQYEKEDEELIEERKKINASKAKVS
jgi:hypothetical protein